MCRQFQFDLIVNKQICNANSTSKSSAKGRDSIHVAVDLAQIAIATYDRHGKAGSAIEFVAYLTAAQTAFGWNLLRQGHLNTLCSSAPSDSAYSIHSKSHSGRAIRYCLSGRQSWRITVPEPPQGPKGQLLAIARAHPKANETNAARNSGISLPARGLTDYSQSLKFEISARLDHYRLTVVPSMGADWRSDF